MQGFVLLLPSLGLLLWLFVYPLISSLVGAFTDKAGRPSLTNFHTATTLYGRDILFTIGIVVTATALTGFLSILLGGYLTLGGNRRAVRLLGALYRWPLFIPFVCAAQMMRTFLAKNGMMNNTLVGLGVLTPLQTQGFLDWRGILITFVWKQLPFVTLLVAGAMAALDRGTIEAARNLGARRMRVLFGIIVPQIAAPLIVACVLTFVTLTSVLSVPMMISAGSPTMITVDMAYRITSFADYGTANALGVISYAMAVAVAWIYLRYATRQAAGQ